MQNQPFKKKSMFLHLLEKKQAEVCWHIKVPFMFYFENKIMQTDQPYLKGFMWSNRKMLKLLFIANNLKFNQVQNSIQKLCMIHFYTIWRVKAVSNYDLFKGNVENTIQ